ncbi:hypothetical protein [Bacteroides acidifaciens]|uniref:hypothetical protein n=1 Tax=Bacteroides acidifaciens TaxID=85831 RepID=UPI001F5610BC|nr:hypothetical protein [Bacteroides acidifaciens]
MDNITDFMKKTLPEFKNEFRNGITDLFLLYIQADKALMKAYLDCVASTGDLKYVNSCIAQQLKREFSLINTKKRNDMPKSSLIQSFSELEMKTKENMSERHKM